MKKYILYILVLFMILVFAYLQGFFHRYPKREVAFLEPVLIGNQSQWIMANGKSLDNPVLLWLHGGPGSSQMPVGRFFNSNLEEDFIVVHWDQRGAGKSNPENFDENTMTIDRYLQDVHEMTAYLKERFQKNRIFLVGHSWGSQIGIMAVSTYPEDYHGYFGVGQMTSHNKQTEFSYFELEKRILESNNQKDASLLSKIGKPPIRNHDRYIQYTRLLAKYGMNMDVSFFKLAFIGAGSGIYTIKDFLQWTNGANRGSGPMWKDTVNWSVQDYLPKIQVPCFFIFGEEDFNTPYVVFQEALEDYPALKEKIKIIPKSSHTPFFSKPYLFYQIVKNQSEIMLNK